MVTKEFRVLGLYAAFDEGVYIRIEPIFKTEVTREEPEEPTPAPTPPILEKVIAGRIPKTEEERIVRNMVRATVEEYQRLGFLPPSPQTDTAQCPPILAPRQIPSSITLHLNKEEYEELKPMVGQIITVTLNLKGKTMKGESHV